MCPLAVRRRRPLPAKQRQGLKSRRHKKATFAHPCATLGWFCCTSLFAQDMQVSLCFSASGSAQALFASVQLLSASDFLSANSICEFVCARCPMFPAQGLRVFVWKQASLPELSACKGRWEQRPRRPKRPSAANEGPRKHKNPIDNTCLGFRLGFLVIFRLPSRQFPESVVQT